MMDKMDHRPVNLSSFLIASSGLLILPLFFWLFGKPRGIASRSAVLFPSFLAVACFAWLYTVSAVVPEPYLDEVFHIPQAQKYCRGKFLEWDDKITTPPGLYLLSLLIPGVVRYGSSLGSYVCDASSLRAANAVALMVLAYLALRCRHEIEARLYEAHSSAKLRTYTQYSLHTALNIALFPLLFFFSGLYYTDVVSTAAVLAAYLNHLKRLRYDQNSLLRDFSTVSLGLFTLFMRQTNVFWVVVYMGAAEAVHAVKTLRPQRVDQPFMPTLFEQVKYYAWRYSIGDVHDPPLHMLWPDDMLFCVLSLGIAALCNPFRVIKNIWPYIAVIVSFGGFVVWNGGVVLGDKSNHVATIHLPQMLYIWPFFAFFSVPLLTPYALPIVNILYRTLRVMVSPASAPALTPTRPDSSASTRRKLLLGEKMKNQSSHGSKAQDTPLPPLSTPLKMIELFFASKILWPFYIIATILLSIAIVRYNTIIHPFTLADNRHYMFYVFRYTIRRAAWIRYALVVPYTISRWMVWGTMAGCSQWFFILHDDDCSAYYMWSRQAPFLSYPLWIKRGELSRQTNAEFPGTPTSLSPEPKTAAQETFEKELERDPLLVSVEPACTSTGLIFLLATTLSLVTAPLVEPRYFIIPWVMWRLLVPAWRLHDHEGLNSVVSCLSPNSRFTTFSRSYDMRLIIETLWFVAINVATGYIFLSKPYVWKAEDGTILDEGRLQRFMW